MPSSNLKRPLLAAMLIALGIVLSPLSIPIGPTKIFPIAHTVNVLAAFMLGPLYTLIVAIGIAVIRIGLGTGTIFAIPGGVPGALVVGIFVRYVSRRALSSFSEIIGSPIGVWAAVQVFGPMTATPLALPLLLASWMASSIVGAAIGMLLVFSIRQRSQQLLAS